MVIQAVIVLYHRYRYDLRGLPAEATIAARSSFRYCWQRITVCTVSV